MLSGIPQKGALRRKSIRLAHQAPSVATEFTPKSHHDCRRLGRELLTSGLKTTHQDPDQQDVVPQGWING